MPMTNPRLPFIRSCIVSSSCHWDCPGFRIRGARAKTWMAGPPPRRRGFGPAGGTSPAKTLKSAQRPRTISRIQTLEHQRRIGAAEAEGIRQHGPELGVVDALAHDRHVREHWIEL